VEIERRRKVSVEYTELWDANARFSRCVEKMATDEFTDWEVRVTFSHHPDWRLTYDQLIRRIVCARDRCKELGGRIKLVMEFLNQFNSHHENITPELREKFAPRFLLEEELPGHNRWGVQNRRLLLRF
jgi:hypothetical protein